MARAAWPPGHRRMPSKLSSGTVKVARNGANSTDKGKCARLRPLESERTNRKRLRACLKPACLFSWQVHYISTAAKWAAKWCLRWSTGEYRARSRTTGRHRVYKGRPMAKARHCNCTNSHLPPRATFSLTSANFSHILIPFIYLSVRTVVVICTFAFQSTGSWSSRYLCTDTCRLLIRSLAVVAPSPTNYKPLNSVFPVSCHLFPSKSHL